MWSTFNRRVAFCIFSALLTVTGVPALGGEGVICHLSCVTGFERFCETAKLITGRPTNRIEDINIYIERSDDGTFSFGSNYVANGAEYPTKIIGFKEATDIDSVFVNLDKSLLGKIHNHQQDALKAFHEHAKIYLRKDVFKADGSSELDLAGCGKSPNLVSFYLHLAYRGRR